MKRFTIIAALVAAFAASAAAPVFADGTHITYPTNLGKGGTGLSAMGAVMASVDTAFSGVKGSVHSPVADIAALKAIPATGATARANGQTAVVLSGPTGGSGALYAFVAASSAQGNDNTVVAPTSGTGRWMKVLDTGDTAYLSVLIATAHGLGASLIGIEDSAGLYDATTVEAALAECKEATRGLATVKNVTGSPFAAKTVVARMLFVEAGAGKPTSLENATPSGLTAENSDAGTVYFTTAVDGETGAITVTGFSDSGRLAQTCTGTITPEENNNDHGTCAASGGSGLDVALTGEGFGAGDWSVRFPLAGERLAVLASSDMDADGIIGGGLTLGTIAPGVTGDIIQFGAAVGKMADGAGCVKGDPLSFGTGGKITSVLEGGDGAFQIGFATATVAPATPGADVPGFFFFMGGGR